MLSTDINEMMQILNGEHADPHHVLGWHDITIKRKKHNIIRVFNPGAKKVIAFDPEHPNNFQHEMSREHEQGFFTLTIPKTDFFRYKLRFTDHDGNTWEAWDPYAFVPQITDMDLYLFGNGTHYEIYNKLGATAITVDGVDGVLFGVWAPNAKRISVVGDFNNWDGIRNPMRSLASSGVWELFIPGLSDYDKYKFEIKSHTGTFFHKSDPYAFFQELRPNTSSMVYNLEGHPWQDEAWMKSRNKKDMLTQPMNVYELHVGSWKRVHEDHYRFMSWPELANELIPYVKEMGYTHIELMPIMEHPFDGSWGYQVTGFYATTSRYGSPKEFMAFVDACHQNNIGVIMDWVPAHFPKDNFALAQFDGTALYEHADPRQGEHPDWGTLIFNYGRNEVKNFLIANALFWLKMFHIDGLRVDAVASMLYLDYGKNDGEWVANEYGGRENIEAVEFMKHMNSIIADECPGVLMIAEESTAWAGVTQAVKYDGLGFNLKWNMGWMNDFLKYMELEPIHKKYHHGEMTFSMVYAYSEKYMLVLSHDEVVHGKKSLVNKMPGDTWQKLANLRAAKAFMMGHPGKKLIFMGGEFAQFEEWSEARELDWFLIDQFDHHKQMQQFTKDLNHLYLKEKALWQKDFDPQGFEWIACEDADRSIFSFCRISETKRRSKLDQEKYGSSYEFLVFVCNFTPVVYEDYRVGVPVKGEYTELINSDDVKYGGSGVVNPGKLVAESILCDGRALSIPIKLPPLACVVLKGKM